MDKELNERIAKYRIELGYTQEQLGKMLGMKTSTYSQLERKGRVDSLLLKKLAEIFCVDVRELLYGQAPKTDSKQIEELLRIIEKLTENNLHSKSKESEIIIGYKFADFTLSVMEESLITAIRNLEGKDRQEVLNFITEIVNKKK